MSSVQENVNDNNTIENNVELKKKPINFRTEMLKGVHSPSDVLSPFSQKISSERNSALKNFKPKSLMDRLLNSQNGTTVSSETDQHKPLKSSLNQTEDLVSDVCESECESEKGKSECEEDIVKVNEEQQ